MTKAQIVSHFAGKFELSKKTSARIIEEVAALAVSEIRMRGDEREWWGCQVGVETCLPVRYNVNKVQKNIYENRP